MLLAAAEPDVARERQVERALEAAAQVVGARLQPDAADQRPWNAAALNWRSGSLLQPSPVSPTIRMRPP